MKNVQAKLGNWNRLKVILKSAVFFAYFQCLWEVWGRTKPQLSLLLLPHKTSRRVQAKKSLKTRTSSKSSLKCNSYHFVKNVLPLKFLSVHWLKVKVFHWLLALLTGYVIGRIRAIQNHTSLNDYFSSLLLFNCNFLSIYILHIDYYIMLTITLLPLHWNSDHSYTLQYLMYTEMNAVYLNE